MGFAQWLSLMFAGAEDAMAGVWNWLLLSVISRACLWHSYAESRTDGC